jgi:hypothetical protein
VKSPAVGPIKVLEVISERFAENLHARRVGSLAGATTGVLRRSGFTRAARRARG